MNTEPIDPGVFTELDGVIRESVERIRDDAPSDTKLQATLSKIYSLADSKSSPVTTTHDQTRAVNWVSNSTLRLVCGLVGVAVLVVGIFSFFSRPSRSLAAQIANSLARQNWVHVVEIHSGESIGETWFSPSQDISARTNNESIEFRDHLVGEFHYYSRVEQTMYRVSEGDSPRRFDHFAELAMCLPMLLSDELPTDPINEIRFLKEFGDRIEFVSQDITRVDDTQLEYEVKYLYMGEAAEIVFLVDGDTCLPQRGIMSGFYEGQEFSYVIQFDYPHDGPKDIYALGVPVNAKQVDRIEKDDEKFLLAAVRAGSIRFDDYRAIAIQYNPEDPVWWVNASKELLYRKQKRWRRSYCFVEFERDPNSENPLKTLGPTKDDDKAKWWAERISKSLAPDGGEGELIDLAVGDQDALTWFSLLPEYQARPPMGGSALNFQVRIPQKPKHGPPGTILFELLRTGQHDVSPDEAALEQPASLRFWIDPDKGYLVIRWEMVGADGSTTDSTTVEDAAQSPKGIWYPTRTKRISAMPDGTSSTQITEFYLDFHAEIPDALFDAKE